MRRRTTAQPEKILLRTAIYIRVSTDKQAKEGDSMLDQLSTGQKYIESYENMILVDNYIDDGISGQKLKRDDFQRLIDDITQAQADAFLVSDVEKFEKKVNKYYEKYKWNQNEFDALVSFAFNIGSIDQLTANGTRSKAVIVEKMINYNKADGKILSGLVRRRQAERKLFLSESGGALAGESKTDAASSVKVDAAQNKDKSLAGVYTITASALRLRAGAGTDKKILLEMPRGEKAQCYGYYTNAEGMKWLYIVYKGTVGFASSKYLKKERGI